MAMRDSERRAREQRQREKDAGLFRPESLARLGDNDIGQLNSWHRPTSRGRSDGNPESHLEFTVDHVDQEYSPPVRTSHHPGVMTVSFAGKESTPFGTPTHKFGFNSYSAVEYPINTGQAMVVSALRELGISDRWKMPWEDRKAVKSLNIPDGVTARLDAFDGTVVHFKVDPGKTNGLKLHFTPTKITYPEPEAEPAAAPAAAM